MAFDYLHVNDLATATLDDTDQIIVGEGNTFKKATLANLKGSIIGSDAEYTEDTVPYLSARQTKNAGIVGKVALEQLVGGSLGWNQLCNGSSVTVPSGHKYYMKKSGTASIGASTGSAITGLTSGTDMVIDLTAMFGSTIADYVYGLEQATAGAGVAWLSKYIDLGTYHAYDAGSIQNVQPTAHVTKDANDNVIGNYPLGSGTLRGIPQLVNNELAYDGDIKTPDGTITRNYGIVDLGTLNWYYTGGYNKFHYANLADGKANAKNMITRYTNVGRAGDVYMRTAPDYVYGYAEVNGQLQIKLKNSAYTDAATFKTAMSGVYLVYEKVTPTTESSTPFQRIQTVDADGTESFTSNSVVPVGHQTLIPENVLGALSVLVG